MNKTMIIVHCSDTYADRDIGAKEIRKWYVEERGWSDIGYHFVINRHGAIEYGRPISDYGAHAKGWNGISVGVCLVGGKGNNDEAEANFTLKQYTALLVLIDMIKKIEPIATIVGHRDLPGVTKECPCFDVQQLIGEQYGNG